MPLRLALTSAAADVTSKAEHLRTIQMVDVHLPTTDRRELVLSRYTLSEPDHCLLLDLLRLSLPEQPPPKITANRARPIFEPAVV